MEFAAAATIPVAFFTAVYALGELARLEPGERVLIHGGAGGVGLAAIQYARHRGAEIFATAGSDAKRALLRHLGVEHVLDSRDLAFADTILARTGGEGVDVVLNSLSGEAMERSLGLLRPFGRFLELGKRDFYQNTPIGLRPLRHNVSYFAIDADQLPGPAPRSPPACWTRSRRCWNGATLRPLPTRAFGFGEAVEAFRLMQAAGHIGKIVLEAGARRRPPRSVCRCPAVHAASGRDLPRHRRTGGLRPRSRAVARAARRAASGPARPAGRRHAGGRGGAGRVCRVRRARPARSPATWPMRPPWRGR